MEPLEWRGGWVLLKKNLWTLPKSYTINLSTSLPQRDLRHFTRAIVHWGKENNQTSGLTGHCLWIDTNSRRLKTFLWSAVVLIWWDRSLWRLGDQWSFSSVFSSHSRLRGSWTHPVFVSLVLRTYDWSRHMQQLAESPHWFSDQWSEGYYNGEVK